MDFGDIFDFAAPVVSGLIGASAQSDTNSANAAQAQQQMDFQERMSNTSYQRQVKDLEAAGLNPMLAYMKSSAGASTPSGSMAVMSSPYEAGSRIASSAYGNRVQSRHADLMEQQGKTEAHRTDVEATAAEQAKILRRQPSFASEVWARFINENDIKQWEAAVTESTWKRIQAELLNIPKQGVLLDSQAGVNRIRKTLMEFDVPEASAFAAFFGTAVGKYVPYSREAGRVVGDVTGAARDFGGLGLKYRQQRFMIHGE